jgi:2-oxoglutarate dehydrogenase complex dehydrogenase (E1) component-like enzyme
VVAPRALVLWEAQFGDFVNGAQVIVDQFITSGFVKWGQSSRLVMLLPHGYEGQGPEHSSARLERFLQQAAENNMRVANCTTPAQYFHLLRTQAHLQQRRPLIIMTPKSLLRHPKATSPLSAFTDGRFQSVLEDVTADPDTTRRVVLCTGKIYYDLLAAREQADSSDVALVRVEMLYPFPHDALRALLDRFADAEVVWAQEEPRNMGAWSFIAPLLREVSGREPRYAGRPLRASPAEGFADAHEREQRRIVSDALEPAAAPRKGRRQRS